MRSKMIASSALLLRNLPAGERLAWSTLTESSCSDSDCASQLQQQQPISCKQARARRRLALHLLLFVSLTAAGVLSVVLCILLLNPQLILRSSPPAATESLDQIFFEIPTKKTRWIQPEIERNVTFRTYHQELVRKINNSTQLWKATLNRWVAPAGNPLMKFERSVWLRKVYTSWSDSRFLAASFRRQKQMLETVHTEHIPVHFDAREQWPFCDSMHEIRNQAGCGACWAAAVAASISDRICIHSTGLLQPRLSDEDLVQCCVDCNGCRGAYTLLDPYMHWLQEGIVTGGAFGSQDGCKPYSYAPVCGTPCDPKHFAEAYLRKDHVCSKTCQPNYRKQYSSDKYYASEIYYVGVKSKMIKILSDLKRRSKNESFSAQFQEETIALQRLQRLQLPQEVDDNELAMQLIQLEMMTNGPVTTCFYALEDFLHYSSGIYKAVGGKVLYGHCVKVIGWGIEADTRYWLATNSWGRGWGENGYFRFIRGQNELAFEGEVLTGIPKLSDTSVHDRFA